MHALAGILISHLSHLVAVIVLYQLTYELIPATYAKKGEIAFTAGCLHVLSPAGLFLSAPCGESAFAFLNFMGMLSYVLAAKSRSSTSPGATNAAAFWTVTAGIWLGSAATIRGNGLLSGMIFAWDAVEAILKPRELLRSPVQLVSFAAPIFAGILVGIGFAAPQVVAYLEYCTAGNSRPWCSRLPPSIYSWVQEHYWDVGFLRYWTLNNLPLFLLAGPMLAILLYTGFIALARPSDIISACCPPKEGLQRKVKTFDRIMPRFALPQIALAIMAATSFHVQIINRVSSGYPVWYIVLAAAIHAAPAKEPSTGSSRDSNSSPFRPLKTRLLQWVVRGMVMYAVVQGGLYASFLPPA